jgi:hypothetical protein
MSFSFQIIGRNVSLISDQIIEQLLYQQQVSFPIVSLMRLKHGNRANIPNFWLSSCK